MKTLRLSKRDIKIDRQVVRKFGEAVYQVEDVESVSIKVDFKDGSTLGFKRHERQDNFDRAMEEEE